MVARMADSGTSTDLQKVRVFIRTSLSRERGAVTVLERLAAHPGAFGEPAPAGYDTGRGAGVRKTCQECACVRGVAGC